MTTMIYEGVEVTPPQCGMYLRDDFGCQNDLDRIFALGIPSAGVSRAVESL